MSNSRLISIAAMNNLCAPLIMHNNAVCSFILFLSGRQLTISTVAQSLHTIKAAELANQVFLCRTKSSVRFNNIGRRNDKYANNIPALVARNSK